MRWLLDEAPDDGNTPVLIRFDSLYAANITRGIWLPKFNEELADMTAKTYAQVCQTRNVQWEHVYGHTGEWDNEMADWAADAGAKGQVSTCSRRWAAPPPIMPEDNVPMDMCRKCGLELPQRELVWHLRRCTSEAQAIPEGYDRCRKCKEMIQRAAG